MFKMKRVTKYDNIFKILKKIIIIGYLTMPRTITSLSSNVKIINVTFQRYWTIVGKIHMIEEIFFPNASLTIINRRNDINPNLIY